MFHGFEPVFDKNSEVLILGSFPSVKSRENGFYYGNPQNRFWKMLSQIFDDKIENDIEGKKAFLKKHKIALYDVVLQSDLNGSADATLEKSNRNLADISMLLPPHTKVKKILCNGKTSFKLFSQNHPNIFFENGETFLIISTDLNFEEKEIKISKNTQKSDKFAKIPIYCLPSTSSANPRFDLSLWQNALTK